MINAAGADFLRIFVWSPRSFCKELSAWARPDPYGGGGGQPAAFLQPAAFFQPGGWTPPVGGGRSERPWLEPSRLSLPVNNVPEDT